MAQEGKFYVERLPGGRPLDHDEPVFVMRGRDAFAIEAIAAYELRCIVAGCSDEHIAGVAAQKQRFDEWQAAHETKVPD